MHLTCSLRARAIAQLPDIRIQFFQLISSIPCQDSLCQLKRKSRNFSKRARTHASCVHGPLFGPLTLEFNFSNWSCLTCVRTDYVIIKWQHGLFSKQNWLYLHTTIGCPTKDRRNQLKKLNSKVRGLNTQGACVRACLDFFRFFFSKDIDCPDIG